MSTSSIRSSSPATDRAAPRFAPLLEDLPPSGTMAVGGKVRELRRQGREIINLGGGMAEPAPPWLDIPVGFPRALNVGGDPAGEADLRSALTQKLRAQGLSYDADEVVVTTGAKQAILPSLLAIVEPGDEVLVLDPCWVSYAPAIRLAGAVPVPVSLRVEEEFRLDARMLADATTSRTRAIIINTPHNPTGRVFTLEELAGVAQLAARRNLWVLCDESFEKFVFDGHRHVSLASLGDMKERTVLIQSFSKGFALPGTRVGYLAAPKRLCQGVIRFNEHVITSVSPLMQSIALSALAHEAQWTERLLSEYGRKRQIAQELLTGIPGIGFKPTEGTFYALIDAGAIEASSRVFVDRLLDEIGVACTPGAAFGSAAEGMVRINLVGPAALLEKGLRRMQAYLLRSRAG